MAKTSFPLGPTENAALERATIVAWSWARATFVAATVTVIALAFVASGLASLTAGLPVAALAGGFAVVAFRRARTAFARIEETPPAESQRAPVRDANWASQYLVY